MNLLSPPQTSADAGAVSSLPALATASDVREAVMFLKRRPEGMTIVKAMSFEQRRLFDARKIEAYEYWGFIHKTGERIRLSPRGQQLARRIESEAGAFGRVLREIAPYRAALEWA
ncbi:MAG: hypothetical protein ACREAM_06130, partial [Blastocatellia bacterium]